MKDPQHDSAGAWAKKYYFASRAVMESVLSPFGLGPTQWYVLYQLASEGPTNQRDLTRILAVERATLSGVVAALVRKGLIDQATDPTDQRQRVLRITETGMELWRALPDPIARIHAVAFPGVDDTDLATTVRVLRTATQHLAEYLSEGRGS
jgi:DNA-binding MarR family transcriptional regulator